MNVDIDTIDNISFEFNIHKKKNHFVNFIILFFKLYIIF